MQKTSDLSVWLPYTQMHTAPYPLKIVRAQGATLVDENGREYLDAISSWWVNIHGHCHPRLQKALVETVQNLDQVLAAGCVHEPVLALTEQHRILPCESGVFCSTSGFSGCGGGGSRWRLSTGGTAANPGTRS